MRDRLTKLATSVIAFIAAAFMTVMATSTPAQQQDRPANVPPALERRETEMARQREMRQRELLRESLGKRPVRAANLSYVQAVIAQVNQDFERIQFARNEIVRAASAEGSQSSHSHPALAGCSGGIATGNRLNGFSSARWDHLAEGKWLMRRPLANSSYSPSLL